MDRKERALDYQAMVLGGVGGGLFGLFISWFLKREGCEMTSCRINRSSKIAPLYYGLIGASLGLTLHVF